MRQAIPPSSNLEVVYLETYRQADAKYPLQEGMLDASVHVKVAGFDALQKTYRVYSGEPAYELRDIWFEKDG